jgi:hypothetical protein
VGRLPRWKGRLGARAVLAAMVVLASAADAASQDKPQKPAVNPRAAAVRAFGERVQAYLELQKKAASGLPPLKETDDPAAIRAYERALAKAIKTLRPKARPGDVFGRDMTPLIVEIIRQDWRHRPAADRAALRSSEANPRFHPRVNMEYPPAQPLATFPAVLLRQLHQLPEDLEYRFVDRYLILRDVKANFIVDVIRDVLPARTAS